ncbi:MAG TPA: glycerophosphodiester phosphodiesterase family protein [Candidatus Saccharimonadales bacterium]|nr:glycerophosphodiester phosphodiesterase family protein [Candidatus Saccharimonadales bacterium]
MSRIIGHRGAAGLALENSPESLLAAAAYDVDAVEFDIRRTKDGQLVIMHDRHTGRVSHTKAHIHDLTLDQLKELELKNGQPIPTLEDVFQALGDKKILVLDIKDSGVAHELLRLLDAYPHVRIELTSLKHKELAEIQAVRPDIPILVLEHFSPFEIIHTARRMRANGISLNMWLMNPLTYRLAKRYNLELRVYTVNHPLLMRFFRKLYPDVSVYTDHPQKFVKKKKKAA